MEKDLILEKKAELILGPPISIKNVRLNQPISRSSAGPDAWSQYLIFEFEGTRVRKTITKEDSDFELKFCDKYEIHKNKKMFLDNVSILPVKFHCPDQIFLNLTQKCIFDCKFCNSSCGKYEINLDSVDSVLNDLDDNINSISLTSSIEKNVQNTVELLSKYVSKIREKNKRIAIGIETYINTTEQIDLLHKSGANEIKINIECCSKNIFKMVCLNKDYELIFNMLAHSVNVFGKGNVSSNIIYGLGETDDEIIKCLEELSSIGVLANLRPLSLNEFNKEKMCNIPIEKITKERMVNLAKQQKKIFEKYNLNPNMKTMCFACKSCDIIPFFDL